jgi:hypothetical protein
VQGLHRRHACDIFVFGTCGQMSRDGTAYF